MRFPVNDESERWRGNFSDPPVRYQCNASESRANSHAVYATMLSMKAVISNETTKAKIRIVVMTVDFLD
jgi:hypothetical protein